MSEILPENLDLLYVLCGGINLIPGKGFVPTDYSDSDQYGMLGGYYRVVAASIVCKVVDVNGIVFSTGVPEKTRERYGDGTPTESAVYMAAFVDEFSKTTADKDIVGPKPKGLLIVGEEGLSTNTFGNIQQAKTAIDNNPKLLNVGFLSSRYHLPRIQGIVNFIFPDLERRKIMHYISAEEVLLQHKPQVYEGIIRLAYESVEAQKRSMNENKGLLNLAMGTYPTD